MEPIIALVLVVTLYCVVRLILEWWWNMSVERYLKAVNYQNGREVLWYQREHGR